MIVTVKITRMVDSLVAFCAAVAVEGNLYAAEVAKNAKQFHEGCLDRGLTLLNLVGTAERCVAIEGGPAGGVPLQFIYLSGEILLLWQPDDHSGMGLDEAGRWIRLRVSHEGTFVEFHGERHGEDVRAWLTVVDSVVEPGEMTVHMRGDDHTACMSCKAGATTLIAALDEYLDPKHR